RDWSSDVCSSDLVLEREAGGAVGLDAEHGADEAVAVAEDEALCLDDVRGRAGLARVDGEERGGEAEQDGEPGEEDAGQPAEPAVLALDRLEPADDGQFELAGWPGGLRGPGLSR